MPLLLVTLALLCLVLVYHTNLRGFRRWIPLDPITFQPSDLAKFTISVVLANYISRYYHQMRKFKYGFVYPILVIAVFCGLIYLEHHMSCTILIFLIGASLMWAGGSNWKLFAIGVGIVAAVAVLVVVNPELLENYAGERIRAWLDKSYSPDDLRWQTNNSLYAIGSGGLFGTGLGNSKQKYLYVSEPQNDFIFSIVCEELGFVGAAFIILLFGLLVWRGVDIAKKCPNRFGFPAGAGYYGSDRVSGGAEHYGGHRYHSQHGYCAAVLQLRRHSADPVAGRDRRGALRITQKQSKSGGKRMKLLFATGGTAGHINPALAVASYLREKISRGRIFVCRHGGPHGKPSGACCRV